MKILCVTNQALCKGDYLQQLQKIAVAKPDAMILREKQLSEPAYQTLAEQVQRICQGQGVQLICNHQISVAAELKIPYDTVMTADFADSECEASAKSCYSARAWSARVL